MEKRPVILVVDDEEPIRKLLRVNLSMEGYGVVTACDGKSAFRAFKKHQPDLIILDITMPGVDGLYVLDLVRQSSNVPVIMLTARDDTITLARTLLNGADDYVSKPFSMLELTARIRAKLRSARHRELLVSGCYEALSQSEEKTITISR